MPRYSKDITIETNGKLISAFPELISLYNGEVSWQEGDETGCHVVFGDVLRPYLNKMLLEKNEMQLQRIFDFLESLLERDEKYLDEVVNLSVLTQIVDDNIGLDLIRLYAGSRTKEMIRKLLEW